MRLLDRYIVGTLCAHVALAMAVLLTLLALFLFINEQGWVGVGRYGSLQALRYVLLNLPAAAVHFLPVGALIGSLLGLGALARGSEFTVMRAAGVSVARLCGSVLLAGLLLVPVALVAGEWVAPPLVQLARVTKTLERSSQITVTRQGAAWVRDGQRILRADAGSAGGSSGVTVFELGEGHALAAVTQASGARASRSGQWLLESPRWSRFSEVRVETGRAFSATLQTQVDTEFLGVLVGDPMDLSLMELSRAVRQLERNGQDARRYRFAWWSGIARLVAIPLALLLAVPFLTGLLRTAQGGARATLGLALGLAYFIAQRMVESGTMAFSLDPLLLAWLPTLLLGAAVALLMLRMQR